METRGNDTTGSIVESRLLKFEKLLAQSGKLIYYMHVSK